MSGTGSVGLEPVTSPDEHYGGRREKGQDIKPQKVSLWIGKFFL